LSRKNRIWKRRDENLGLEEMWSDRWKGDVESS